jgi:protein SCO1/2
MVLMLTMNLSKAASKLPVYASLGGEFTLTNMHNQPASLLDWRGKVVILTFGFTSCPHICPTILMQLSKLYGDLEDAAQQQVQIVFISIDPKRDTAERLQSYLLGFDANIIGLTGSEVQLRQVAQVFGAVFNHAGEVSHSDRIYLLDDQGQVRQVYAREGQFTQMQQDVRQLLPRQILSRQRFCDRLPASIAKFCRP